MSTALALQNEGYDQAQMDLLINHICKGFDEVETRYFVNVAKRVNLDPFKRQIYAAPRYEKDKNNPEGPKKKTMVIMTSIEGLRAIAARCKTAEGSDAYAGNDKPLFTWVEGQDRVKDYPYSAECTVWKIVNGERYPFPAEVFFTECVQEHEIWEYDQQKRKRVPTGKFEPNAMWKKRPLGQLGKCAEAAALRKAFPEETAGLYIDAEGPSAEERQDTPKPKPEHTSSHVQQDQHHEEGGETQEAEATVLPPEDGSNTPTWQQLAKGDKWKGVKMGKDMPFEGETIEFIAKTATKLKEAWSKVPADTLERAALYAEQWTKIERYIAAQNTNVADVELLLKQTQVLGDDIGIMDCPGHKLPKLYESIKKAIREKESPPAQQGE